MIDDQVEIKYQHLNPATYFREVVEVARSVVLAGGTMSPVSHFRALGFHIQREIFIIAIDFRCYQSIIHLATCGEANYILLWSHYPGVQPSDASSKERTSGRRPAIQI